MEIKNNLSQRDNYAFKHHNPQKVTTWGLIKIWDSQVPVDSYSTLQFAIICENSPKTLFNPPPTKKSSLSSFSVNDRFKIHIYIFSRNNFTHSLGILLFN